MTKLTGKYQDEGGEDCSGGGGEPTCTTVTEEKCETRYLLSTRGTWIPGYLASIYPDTWMIPRTHFDGNRMIIYDMGADLHYCRFIFIFDINLEWSSYNSISRQSVPTAL